MARRIASRKIRQLAVAAACWVSVAASASVADTVVPPATQAEPAQEPLAAAAEAGAATAETEVALPQARGQLGKVTYYAKRHKGRRTASGERYDPTELTMAHRTLPLGTRVRVTNLHNHRSVLVRVNDRGPYARGYIADLSLAAARQLGMLRAGIVEAELHLAQGSPQAQAALEAAPVTSARTARRTSHRMTHKLARKTVKKSLIKSASKPGRRVAQR
jgi:rare lipoprotein A